MRSLSAIIPRSHQVEFDLDPLSILKVADCGDIPGVGKSNVEQTFSRTTEMVSGILEAGAFPMVIGGDHSITYPILKAYSQHFRGKIGLIHFDAHIDVLDKWGTEDYSCASWLRRSIEELPNLKGENYTMIGARGFWMSGADVRWMRDNGLKVYTMVDVDELGIDACVQAALDRAWDGTQAVYLTFDGDGIDPAYAPGIGLPTPGGLTAREAIRAVRKILRTGVHGMDLVELTPFQENEALTSTYLAVTLLKEALSGLAMGRRERG